MIGAEQMSRNQSFCPEDDEVKVVNFDWLLKDLFDPAQLNKRTLDPVAIQTTTRQIILPIVEARATDILVLIFLFLIQRYYT